MTRIAIIESPVPALFTDMASKTTEQEDNVTCLWNKHMLNQSEIKITRDSLSLLLSTVDDLLAELKDYREGLWVNCNPSDPASLQTFKEMNKVKTTIRKLKKNKATIQSVLYKLKQQSKLVK